MLTLLANTLAQYTGWPFSPLLAQDVGPSPSFSWGIVLFFVILGLLVTLSPVRRTSEIKKRKDD